MDTVTVDLHHTIDASVSAAIAKSTASTLGFDAKDAAEVATSAAELASNAILHAGGGFLEVQGYGDTVVLTVIDRGPGNLDVVNERLRQQSTIPTDSHGLGYGLGAVARLMTGVLAEAREGGGLLVCAWKKRRQRGSL